MITVDFHSRQPIYEQIEQNIKALILSGVLQPGSQLPSVRNLAVDLGINPNTIRHAYQRLETEGVITTLPARGCFVSENVSAVSDAHKEKLYGELSYIFGELKKLEKDFDKIKELYDKA